MEISQRVVSWDALKKKPPDATYIVDPPDEIKIEFMSPVPPPEEPRMEVLRQDGVVTLPYLEDVQVGGLTTIQIREKLEDLYSKYYKEPKILVTVTGYNSKHIFVYGESGRQGWVPYRGHQTFSDVIGEVGGVTERAAYWRCKVIRGDPDNPEITSVNFRKIMLEGRRAAGRVARRGRRDPRAADVARLDRIPDRRSALPVLEYPEHGRHGRSDEVHRDELHRISRLGHRQRCRLLAAGRWRSLEPTKLCILNISG